MNGLHDPALRNLLGEAIIPGFASLPTEDQARSDRGYAGHTREDVEGKIDGIIAVLEAADPFAAENRKLREQVEAAQDSLAEANDRITVLEDENARLQASVAGKSTTFVPW